jgi:murein DD-endopeptidase MepM/ murein hydrolase activator NlpD
MALNLKFPLPDEFLGEVTSRFGWRWIFGKWGFHNGQDHACPNGTSYMAPYKGIVVAKRWGPLAGNIIEIHHPSCGDVVSACYHLRDYLVNLGDEVEEGQGCAHTDNTGMMSTGPHAHLGLKINGKWVNPAIYYGPYAYG